MILWTSGHDLRIFRGRWEVRRVLTRCVNHIRDERLLPGVLVQPLATPYSEERYAQ
jgi:hypothetical protein